MQKLIDKYKAELEVLKQERSRVMKKQKTCASNVAGDELEILRLRRFELRGRIDILGSVIDDLQKNLASAENTN